MRSIKHLKFFSIGFSIVLCLFLYTIVYSAISSTVKITGVAYARAEADVRITSFNVYKASSSASSQFEEFGKDSVSMGVFLPNSDSYVMYKIEVTNYGDDVGIYSINGLPEYLDYELVDYSLKNKLCDSSNKCSFGSVSVFYIKIKWKNYNSSSLSNNMILNFDFRNVYSISYSDIIANSNYPVQIMDGEELNFKFIDDISNIINIYVDGSEVSRSTYVYNNKNGYLSFSNISGDLVIEKAESTLIDGRTFSANVKNFVDGTTDAVYNSENLTVTYIGVFEDRIPSGYTKEDFLSLPSLDVSDDGRTKVYNDNGKIYIYSIDDILANSDSYSLFRGYTNLTELDISELDTKRVYSAQSMFAGLSSLEYIDLSNFNTTEMGTMQALFSGCSSLKSLDLSKFNTVRVRNLAQMFCECSSLTSLDLSSFVNVKVTDMSRMFDGCSSITNINFGSFDSTTVTIMSRLFYYCESLEYIDISMFNTSNVTDMTRMFGHCGSLKKIHVGNGWNTSNVTISERMFGDCVSIPSYVPGIDDVSRAYVGFDGYLSSIYEEEIDSFLNVCGGEVCLGNECFYVMKNDGTTVTMLAKYSLYVGGNYDDSVGVWTAYGSEATGLQDSTMKAYKNVTGDVRNGTSMFSSSAYWSDDNITYPKYVYNSSSILYPYLENYKTYLTNNGATINVIRLLSYEDLLSLNYDETNEFNYVPTWVASSSYWTGIAVSNYQVYSVSMYPGLNQRDYNYKNSYGVRPVIEMDVSEIRRIYSQ